MAEEKDYVGILWQDQLSWIGDTPQETIQNVKRRLIELGAEPGTTEYETAFVNILNRGMITEGKPFRAGGLAFTPSPAGREALDYLKKNMTVKEIKEELGIDPLGWGLGKDRKGAWRSSKTGELIGGNDPYQRNQFGERKYTPEGLAGYMAGTPGTIRTGKWDSDWVKLSDLKKVPDEFFSIFKDFPVQREMSDGSITTEERPIPQELIDLGIVPGAEVTPELLEKYEAWSLRQLSPQTYSEYTGKPYAAGYDLLGNYVGEGAVDSFGNLIEGTDSSTGDSRGIYTASDGRKFNDPDTFATYQANLDEKKADRKSAFDLLFSEFKQYGLETLVTPLKGLIEESISPSEFTLRLRETDAYKKRFAANAQRVAKGLRALSEAEYIGTEDQYQDVMRRYGMPESYYTKGELGIQTGFERFLAGDVSAVELEDRIQTAQNRVVNSNPEVTKALKEFYPGISNGDILAYVLDPANAIEQIKRKVTAAEIGGAAIQAGLQTGMTRAEELAAAGITKQQAQQGFQTVAEVAPRGSQLAEIYKQNPYTQQTAEQEVFGLAGSVDAAKQRKKLTSLETAAFSGSAGAGAIARDRAGGF